jgi:hypothetical protein
MSVDNGSLLAVGMAWANAADFRSLTVELKFFWFIV